MAMLKKKAMKINEQAKAVNANLALVCAFRDQCLEIKLQLVQLQKQLIVKEEQQKTLMKMIEDNSKEDTDEEGESDWL